tara:strand:+ start:26720 stop:26947 length:228 start_codon:yes stop_codon:yes gene_type:complete
MSKNSNNKYCDPNSGCCSSSKTTTPIDGSIVRRDFIKTMGLATGGVLIGIPAIGMKNSNERYSIPTEKGSKVFRI